MRWVRFSAAIFGGMALWMAGFAVLGVPADLAGWRWICGLALVSGGIAVWDKWA